MSKEVFLLKALKQCHITEIGNEKMCNMYLSTGVHKELKCEMQYLKSR